MIKNIFYLGFALVNLLAIAFHLYTAYLSMSKGFIAFALTLSLPVLAEIYWLIKLWNEDPIYKTIFFFIFIMGILKNLFFNKND